MTENQFIIKTNIPSTEQHSQIHHGAVEYLKADTDIRLTSSNEAFKNLADEIFLNAFYR